MKSKLFEERPKTARISDEKWVRVMPDSGDGYHLQDVLKEVAIGRILFDDAGHWIYDGDGLTVAEQEDVAGFISGNQKEMNELIRDLYEKEH